MRRVLNFQSKSNQLVIKNLYVAFLVLFIINNVQCQSKAESYSEETQHFIIHWEKDNASSSDVEKAKSISEEIYTVYLDYLGKERLPNTKIAIHLGGPGLDMQNGDVKIPHVDLDGNIHIYRFPHGYFGELAHEMIHAIRIYKGFMDDWFLEEAFAEAVASNLFPDNVGFNRYGYPLTIAAGSWVDKLRYIPLRLLKENHNELSMKCSAQSYALRADFFVYLEKTYGKDKYLSFVYDANSKNYSSYVNYFDKSFDELEKDWLENLRERIDNIEDFEEQKHNYLTKSAVRFIKICEADTDF